MSAPKIDMSKPHPRPRPFHSSAECGVCRGLSAPDIDHQVKHAAHVQLEADQLISTYREQQAAYEAHQAEDQHRDNVEAVTGVRPKTAAEFRAEVPPTLRLLLTPDQAEPTDLAAVKARTAADAKTLDRRAAAAKLANRRARITRALAEMPVDAFEAIAEFREQLAAIDREAVAAGQEPEAMTALADALGESSPAAAAPAAAGTTPTTPPPPPKQPRDAVGRLLFGGE